MGLSAGAFPFRVKCQRMEQRQPLKTGFLKSYSGNLRGMFRETSQSPDFLYQSGRTIANRCIGWILMVTFSAVQFRR